MDPSNPSLTAHFPLPPPRCRSRAPPAQAGGRATGPFVPPGKTAEAEQRPPQPPPVSTPSSGRWGPSPAWVRQSRARRAGPSYRLKGSGPRTPGTGTPALENLEAQRGSLWLAAGWRVIPRLPGESPKGKDPTQREMSEQSGRGVAGSAEGGRQVCRAPDPPKRESRFCANSSRNNPGM